MRRAIDRSLLTRLLQAAGLSLALMMVGAGALRAEMVTVQGDDGAPGADAINPFEDGGPGGDGGSAGAGAGTRSLPP